MKVKNSLDYVGLENKQNRKTKQIKTKAINYRQPGIQLFRMKCKRNVRFFSCCQIAFMTVNIWILLYNMSDG